MIVTRNRLRAIGLRFLAIWLVVSQFLVFAPQGVRAASSTILISQIQTTGLSSANDEFVELYNASGSSVDIGGWTIQYKPAVGGSYTTKGTVPVGILIPSHRFYLLATSSYSLGVTPDLLMSSGLAQDGGHIRLVNAASSVVDTVGWGTADSPEGTAAVAPAAGKSIERLPGGVSGNGTDTDNNANDFVLISPSSPRDSISLAQPSTPSAPILQSPVAGDGQVTLSWSAVSGAKDYIIYQDGTALATPVVGLTATVTGLTNGHTYTFQVAARSTLNVIGALSNSQSATPAAAVVIPVTPIPASIAYYPVGSATADSSFGVTNLNAQVTLSPTDALPITDQPTLTFARPNTAPVVIPLSYNATTKTWNTIVPYSITKSTGNQDGTVSVTLTDGTKPFSIVAGGTFTVATGVADPIVTINPACSPTQDSLTATVTPGVVSLLIYKAATADLPNLLATASVVNGKVDPIYIGDNAYGTLYVVAVDQLGNRSNVVAVANPITAPAQPLLQLMSGNQTIEATWPDVSGATSYVLRWQPVGSSQYQERIVSTRTHDLSVPNGVPYQVSVAAQDAACNRSAFTVGTAMAQTPIFMASAGKGGVADQTVADHEAQILAQVRAEGENQTKDGVPTGAGEAALEAQKIAQQKAAEEAQKAQQAQQEAQRQKQEAQQQAEQKSVKDRSRIILGLAILLILAGAGIAAYSWYQGDHPTPPTTPKPPSDKPSGEAPAVAPVEKPKAAPAGKKRQRGKKRKTNW